MGKVGFIFAGQGSQYIGMGQDLCESYIEVREAFEKAENILGYSLKDICFNGKDEDLARTDITQASIFTLSAGISEILKNNGIKADAVCGLSLGEYSALYCGEALDFRNTIKLLAKRGEIMANAYPRDKSAMFAVIGLSKEEIQAVLEEVRNLGVAEIANLNCPGQIVVTGNKTALDAAYDKFLEKKAMKVVKLDVSGPFHSSLLREASFEFEKELRNVKFNEPKIPVYTNYTGKEISFEKIIDTLKNQMCSTVYFEENIRQMIESGIDIFIEIGPGKALSGFVKRIDRKKKIFNVENVETLNNVINKLK